MLFIRDSQDSLTQSADHCTMGTDPIRHAVFSPRSGVQALVPSAPSSGAPQPLLSVLVPEVPEPQRWACRARQAFLHSPARHVPNSAPTKADMLLYAGARATSATEQPLTSRRPTQ